MGRYEVVQHGDRTCFVVQPASAPFPFGFGLVCVICGALGFVNAGFFVAFVVILPLLLIRWKGQGASRYRNKTSFEVTPAGITISGGEIPREGIHRLILRNHVSRTEQGSTPSSTFVVPQMAAAVFAMGQKHRTKLARISWRLDVDARGKACTLAGGLDETTAYGLMSDVERALKDESRPASAPPSSPAGFCAKCGAALTTGARFCAKCGSQQ
ncbi:MAG: zinc ribbon domain-containing protein [Terriglobia bacterium]|jgi:hypothetical protein